MIEGTRGGRARGPLFLSLVLLCVLVPACDRDRTDREVPRPEGRAIDEPFADLIVTAGPTREDSRLYALDLLNLELDRLAPERVTRIIGTCEGRPIVVAIVGGRRTRMEFGGRGLSRVPRGRILPGNCHGRSTRHIPGWISHGEAPNGHLFLTDGNRVAVARGDDIEVLGRTELPIWSAVWAR